MILTDREIKIAVERRLIEVDPSPDFDIALSSTALDLTLDPNIRTFKQAVSDIEAIDPGQVGFDWNETIGRLTQTRKIPPRGYLLNPATLILAWTTERVSLDIGTRIAARVEGKSSLARLGLGVHVTAPTIHAGFTGNIQLEMVNHGAAAIRLRTGMRICQLIFETTLGTPERGYRGQFLGQTTTRKAKPR